MFDNVPGLTKKILCSISEPVILFNENFRIQWINPAAEIFFNHSTEYIFGKMCTHLFSDIKYCSKVCPIRKSFDSNETEYLIMEGINAPLKQLESIPFKINNEKYTLAIIHSIPNIDKNRILKHDFATKLNGIKEFKNAIPFVETVILTLTSVSASTIGFYIKNHNNYKLYSGKNLPTLIPYFIFKNLLINKPLYLSAKNTSFISEKKFPNGFSLIPIINPKKKIKALLFIGCGTLNSNSRNKLEMIASVLGDCIDRFFA